MLFSIAVLAAPSAASAHLELTFPTSRYGGDVLKAGPCGRSGGARSANVFTFAAGATIPVTWTEYIDHPGHYRIAFDEDGDDDFVDPVCTSGCDTRRPTIEMYNNDTVLIDDIADASGGDYSVQVTLPNVECTRCTLQVIQVMYDKPPYTLPGNDLYYQCIDLVLVPGGTGAGDMNPTPSNPSSDPGGCACVGLGEPRSSAAWASIASLLLLGLLRRAQARTRRASH